MALSSQRLLELQQLYMQLKDRCRLVDDKYSLTTLEPNLDLPPTLNLEKLVYTPKTEAEMTEIAESEVAAAMIAKERNVEQNYSTKLKNISLQKDKLNSRLTEQTLEAQKKLSDEQAEIQRKVVDNGLYFSTVAYRYNELAQKRYGDKLTEIGKSASETRNLLTKQETDAEQLYNLSLASLEEERQARIRVAYQKLSEKEGKLRVSIEKYNNGLEEKEQKYQYSRAKAYESALRAQENKALKNAELYAQLGESEYNRLIEKEKYAICTDVFSPLTRSEGQAILQFDSFLKNNLGSYYSTFAEWVNSVLPAG